MLRLLMALVLALIPVSANAGWIKAESDHFIVYSKADAKKLRGFVERVEHFDALLRRVTRLDAADTSPNKLIILIVSSEGEVQRQSGKDSKNIAGFYRPAITGSFVVVPQSAGNGSDYDINEYAILFHEYVHHFMLQYFPTAYAPWYVEGFAEYFSTTEFKENGQINFGVPARFRFYDLVIGDPFPVKRMFAPELGKMSTEETSRFYAWAWLLTHYLYLSDARKGQLRAYLDAFAAGGAPEAAAVKGFGDLAKLQKDLVHYRDSENLSYLSLKGSTLPPFSVTLTGMDAAQNAMMPLFIRLTRGSHDEADAAGFVAEARAMAARYPNHPMALEMLAEGELDVKKFDAASVANTALLTHQPQNARALLRKARIAIAQIDGNGDAATWKPIRGMIVAANRAATNDPFPLQLYFESFARPGLPPTPVAMDGLGRAIELAPQVSDLRFMFANQLMRDKKPEQARATLEPLLNDPHSADIRKLAHLILGDAPANEPAPADPPKASGKDK